MFKFSFKVEEDQNTHFGEEEAVPSPREGVVECHECEEVFPVQKHLNNKDIYELHSEVFPAGSVGILHMKTGVLLKTFFQVNQGNIGKAESCHTDLIPGVYEGGAKIWECTEDLINYLDKEYTSEDLQGEHVLDLGCGAGILGIYAMKSNAAIVHFQDYNIDVLDSITIPTVLLNLPNYTLSAISGKAKFYSGDWERYVEATKCGDKFDIIFTSETIYNPANYKKLLDTLEQKLKPNGVVLLAAKAYYFGVGGGLRQFEELIDREGRFQYQTVWKSEIGVCREILKISKKNDK